MTTFANSYSKLKMDIKRKPDWLKIKLHGGENYVKVKQIVEKHHLNTICSSGKCPNMGECWSRGTATFMISGDICTRSCKFCATKTGKPLPLEINEPLKIAQSIQLMELKHCVITSVDRDDLTDKSANHWANTIIEIRKLNPEVIIEVLIPDFDCNESLLDIVLNSKPDIVAHNVETVERLTPDIRTKAKYQTSLDVIRYISDKDFISKSGIMVGIGETEEEVIKTMKDLIDSGCQIFTIGQYLQPTVANIPVKEYITPQQFELYKKLGLEMGFKYVESGPLVRSSYMADKSNFFNKKTK